GRVGIAPQHQGGNRQRGGQRGARDARPRGRRVEEVAEGVQTEIASENPDLEAEGGELAKREGGPAQPDQPGAAGTERARRGVAASLPAGSTSHAKTTPPSATERAASIAPPRMPSAKSAKPCTSHSAGITRNRRTLSVTCPSAASTLYCSA